VKQKPPHIIVIRCSLLDGFDPIGEIDNILKRRKGAWFGKYGQPIGPETKQTLDSKERKIYAVLVRKGKDEEGGQYIFKAYNILDVMRDELPVGAAYPKYYAAFMDRIRTWVFLAPYDGPDFNLGDLTTRSSFQPLRNSLSQSMKGHFNCVLRIRENI
jgi:hypothetical protein